MINDENRREVAQKLRDAATECYNYGVLESDVLNILGVYATDSACLVSSDSVMDVADLIDRPTCKKEEHDEYYWRCTRCGGFICWDAVTDCCGVIPTRYCPHCGAEVKE